MNRPKVLSNRFAHRKLFSKTFPLRGRLTNDDVDDGSTEDNFNLTKSLFIQDKALNFKYIYRQAKDFARSPCRPINIGIKQSQGKIINLVMGDVAQITPTYATIAPGEWYLDREAGRLYYKPMPGEEPDRTEAVAGVFERVIEVRGEAGPGPKENR